MADERRIVAMGGGWLAPERRLLDAYVIGLTGKERPRVCFLPTAVGDAEWATLNFYSTIDGRAETSHLKLFQREVVDLRAFLLDHDAIAVSGGNTANALAVWRVHGVDAILREAWEAGIVLYGSSAGMICWFERSVTDSYGPLAALDDGLGFLPGSACPHYDGEPERRPTYTRLVANGFPGGYAADDGAALSFAGTELAEVVAWLPSSLAYRVEARGETALDARAL
ncbi:MAG: Type 1 glutamine amidotransferase-like domain-containing protein [Gaiellaceae bacterium]